MPGPMQNWPLTAERILDHAAQWRPDCEIVARTAEGQIQRSTYGALGARARRLAAALANLGVGKGDRVAVLGSNSPRALEAIYGALGLGAVAHPVAPGLPPARLAALLDQAQDVVLFADPAALSGLDEMLAQRTALRQVVVMAEPARMPQTGLPHVVSHDSLIDQAPETAHWGGAGEADAALLFHTVGAGSGQPKGVLWPHRSTVLAALIASDAEALGFTAEDVVLPVTPFWRSGAWGMVFAAPAAGCKLALPGPMTDAASLLDLIQSEGVTFALGSPSEIEALADRMAAGGRPASLKRVMTVGAPCPPALVSRLKDFGVQARCAWGMVEACGLGAIGQPGALRPPFGVELEIADASGNRLPHDGQAIGRLKVRGPAAASAYFPEGSGPAPDADGYLETGDLAAIDADGRVRIADRVDEVMSIGGAWVSPRAIEAVAQEHPATAQAAVISFPDERGNEAPLLVVRRRPGANAGKADYLAFVGHKLRAGQKPADAIFVDALPLDVAGRVDKRTLRERLERHRAKSLGLPPPPPARAAPPPPAPLTAAAAAAPLLYSPELEPRVVRGAESEFAPIRLAPQSPAPAPASAELPADAGDPVAPGPVDDPAVALSAPIIDLPAEPAPVPEAAPAQTPEAPLHLEPAPAQPEAALPAAPPAEPVAASAAVATPAASVSPLAAEAAEPAAAPAVHDDALSLEPREPQPEAMPFALPGAARKPRRQAPRWARIVLAVTLLVAFVPLLLWIVGLVGIRYGLIDWRMAEQASYGWPFKAAMVGVVSGIVGVFAALLAGFSRLWRRALLGLIIPIASLAGLVSLHNHAESKPPIHDVATDWKTPVMFSPALLKQRGPAANAVEADPVVPAEAGTYMYRRVADVNAETCPGARPVMLSVAPAQAYARAKAALQAKGLKLVSDDAAHGRIEATALSPVFRFKSDLAVRVEPQESGSRVDLRAVSRVGQSDRGVNCSLVVELVQAIQGG